MEDWFYLCYITNNEGSNGQKTPGTNEYIGIYCGNDQKHWHRQQIGTRPRGQKYPVWIHAKYVDNLQRET